MRAELKHKVLFIIPTLGVGGAERVLIQRLHNMSREKFWPHVALFNKTGTFLKEVPDDVPVYDLGKRSRYSFFTLQWRVNRLVRELGVDAVVTLVNYTNIVALLSRSLFGWRRPLVICEVTTLGPSLGHQRFASLKRRLIRTLYPRADAIVAVSKGCKSDLMESVGVPGDKITVIYNPVDMKRIRAEALEPVDAPGFRSGIIAVGRLTAAKDYPTLLRAFRTVRKSSDVRLTIVGEGAERARLEDLSRHLGIADSVSFPGFVRNIYDRMVRSELLVLSSAWEGFPNVILEAMACGTPVVATDCRSGPGEIIRDGENGMLVPPGNDAELARAMLRVLGSEVLRRKFAQAGAERVKEFRVEDVTRQYEAVLLSVINGT